MKEFSKWHILASVFFLCLVIIPITLSKYSTTIRHTITLNARQPEYDISFNQILPDEYQELEYIEATGTQRVNTGISGSKNIYAEIDVEYTATSSGSQIILGKAVTAGNWAGQYGGYYASGSSHKLSVNSNIRKTLKITFNSNGVQLQVDKETVSRSGNSSSTNYYIFTAANGTSYASKAKLYNAKIFDENHILIRNFIPCYRKSDNIIGLYDMINKNFYTTLGTGTFSKGADVPNDYHDIMSPQHFVYDTAQNLNANTYTREGYTFTGWNTKPDGSGTAYTDEQSVNNLTSVDGDEIKLYAQWIIDGYKPLDYVADSTTKLNTDYGLVDVIWLSGDSNTVSQTANEPDLYTELGADQALTPVTWTYYEDGITVNEKNVNWKEDETAKSTWYSYTAEKGNDGKYDNITSMWANAKNSDGSYFVWIPRYAYRITYYEDASYTKVTGYYDGYGMWSASDGKLKFDIDEGIETIDYDGKKYIVHPAFMNDTAKLDSSGNALSDYDRGGWDKDLTGIWVAKYEMSRAEASAENSGSGYQTTFLSVPGVRSAGSVAIGNMYQIGKTYDLDKESHMIKNSEWGAVAYLTHSQYGRNGHQINVNNSNLTGNGGATTSAADESETYEYNTILGAKASSTGNVYGIYDMSGGLWEHVASYDKLGARLTYNKDQNKGTIILSDVTDSSGNYISTKYMTAYVNDTDDKSSASKLFEIGKVGDATKEVRQTTEDTNWFSDNSVFVIKNAPYFGRGGGSGEGIYNGIFYSDSTHGQPLAGISFRISLGK